MGYLTGNRFIMQSIL